MRNFITKLNNNLKNIYGLVERTLGPTTKTVIGIAVVGSLALLGTELMKDKSEITNSTVMITSMNEQSGGSGSVISSEEGRSTVLTNGHVCEVAVNGGLVKTGTGQKHTIVGFKKSKVHDLCLITVLAKLPGRVSLAPKAPDMYELATVSGHPGLLPNVVTQGHFSGNKIDDVFVGLKKCTDEDRKNEQLNFLCFFFGGIPQIKTYETVLVTATIMPGSSGSAIYNSQKELSAVVFAGSGEIGYAYAVPYEFVKNFINEEVATLETTVPKYELDIAAALSNQGTSRRHLKNITTKCEQQLSTVDVEHKVEVERLCDIISRDSSWRNN